MRCKNITSLYVGQLSKINTDNLNLIGAVAVCRGDENFTIIEAEDKYFQLIGYTREELYGLFSNGFRTLIYEEDLPEVMEILCREFDQGENRHFSFSVRFKNKVREFKKFQLEGKLFYDNVEHEMLFSIYITEVTNEEINNHLSNISDTGEYSTIIDSLAQEEYFSVNLIENVGKFSAKFAERFGVGEVVENFPYSLLEKGIITKDSATQFEKKNYTPSKKITHQEYHLIGKDGKPCWYTANYIIVGNTNGEAIRIIGKLRDITKERNEIHQLTEKAEKDQLTGLYNKSTTERIIKETLQNRRVHDSKFALIIIDVDNFKTINDNLGHQYGDKLLMDISESLKMVFRGDDVVGRIGGDEFFVFLKSYGNTKILEDKATAICNLLRTTHGELKINISASIGISTCPEHGSTFKELYEKADIALYATKENGKDGFTIFTDKLTLNKPTSIKNTRSSDKNISEYIFKLMNSHDSQEKAIQDVLKVLGQNSNFTRASIFEREGDTNTFSNTFVWTNARIEEYEDSENLPIYKVDDLLSKLEENDLYIVNKVDDLPPSPEKRNYKKKGIKSLISFAIRENKKINAFIRFDDCTKEREFSIMEMESLSTISFFVGAYLKSYRHLQMQKGENQVLLGILNNIGNFVYVIDYNSYEILFENEMIEGFTYKNSVGKKCYEAYVGAKSPCINCPIFEIADVEKGININLINHWLSGRVNVYTTVLEWKGNKKAVLLSCKDVIVFS